MSNRDESNDDDGLATKAKKGISTFFFGDDGDKAEKGGNAHGNEAQTRSPATRISGSHPVVSTAAPGTPDPAIRKVLEADVTAAALPAYDAYRKLDASLVAVISDETTRIRAVLAALKGQGHDLAAIDKDLGECLTALDAQLTEAENSAKRKLGERVLSKQKRIGEIDAELGRLTAERSQLDSEAGTARVEIENRQSSIEATVAAYKTEIETARQNINRIGKGG